MAYSDFKTINQVKASFDLNISLINLFTQIEPIEPSEYLKITLKRNLQVAFDNDTEKARSELIIAPLLIEIKEIFNGNVSLFSGRDFNVDIANGLNGFCDYILSASEFTLEIEAPVIAIVEAKNESTNVGLGQCIAEMVAAQKFNEMNQKNIPIIYGSVSSGTQWRFLKLEGQTVTLDLRDYPLPPVEQILGFLVWMLQAN